MGWSHYIDARLEADIDLAVEDDGQPACFSCGRFVSRHTMRVVRGLAFGQRTRSIYCEAHAPAGGGEPREAG